MVETDLGEYVIQLRGETPSHLIAPVIHLSTADIAEDFLRHHDHLPPDRDTSSPAVLIAEARGILRPKFLAADVGITGANLLVAKTGSAIVVTNEGNADLTLTLPRVHIVVTSIEKVVPTLDDAWALVRLLARSATGQEITAYTTLVTGPRRAGDPDGPEECHVVLVDNGRSELLRQRHARGSALHPLRGLHESLPGLLLGRRARLWLDLRRPHRGGAVAGAGRGGGGGRVGAGLDVLRALRAGVPSRDSAR